MSNLQMANLKILEHTEFRDETNASLSGRQCFNKYNYQAMMEDPDFRARMRVAQRAWKANGTTVSQAFSTADWTEFTAPTMLEIIEGAGYNSVTESLFSNVNGGTGLTYKYRYYDDFVHPEYVGESDEFKRKKKGQKSLREIEYHTFGLRSYVTEEERTDLPFDNMRLELNAAGAGMKVEKDKRGVHALYEATDTEYENLVFAPSATSLTVNDLLLATSYMRNPFTGESENLSFTPLANKDEQAQRLNKFKCTDILMPTSVYYGLLKNSTLQNQAFWNATRILDNGALDVPLVGARIWEINTGYFAGEDGNEEWVENTDVYFVDRNQFGGVNAQKVPLTIRQWENPSLRTMDWHIYERSAYVVKNRRAVLRVSLEAS